MARRVPGKTIGAAVIGYGMGKHHATYMNDHPDFDLKAVCDLDAGRRAAAEKDFPQIDTCTNMGPMLRRKDIDLVAVVTPHHAHCKHVCQCLRAGKHTVVDKPMCVTAREATRMIGQAKKSKKTLSVFQNRRLDGDYLAIREVVRQGLIGDVFQIECFAGGYDRPSLRWRSDRKLSGGAMYDWGAHFIDWILGLVPAKVASVTGFFHKLVWDHVTNEDQGRAIIRFANGAVGDFTLSSIDMVGKERWRVLGTRGGITLGPNNTLKVRTLVKGHKAELSVPFKDTRWQDYYANIADHLLRGEPLLVRPEESRRVIGVIEAAEKSAKAGRAVPVPHE